MPKQQAKKARASRRWMITPRRPKKNLATQSSIKRCILSRTITKQRFRQPAPGSSLADRFPDVASEWDKSRNGRFTPSCVHAGSKQKVFWICAKQGCGYSWCARIVNRTSGGTGCPACAGKVVTDANRLSLRYPELISEWDATKNGDLSPEMVTVGSKKKIHWICSKEDCQYSWMTPVYSRTSAKSGCPRCAGNIVTDSNRLSIVRPELASEWNHARNGQLGPEHVAIGCSRKVWWICSERGHEWETSICHRAIGGCGCPECARVLYHFSSSRTEQRLVAALKQALGLGEDETLQTRLRCDPDLVAHANATHGTGFRQGNILPDIYLRAEVVYGLSMDTCIEYDSHELHMVPLQVRRDCAKTEILLLGGQRAVIRIREGDLPKLSIVCAPEWHYAEVHVRKASRPSFDMQDLVAQLVRIMRNWGILLPPTLALANVGETLAHRLTA